MGNSRCNCCGGSYQEYGFGKEQNCTKGSKDKDKAYKCCCWYLEDEHDEYECNNQKNHSKCGCEKKHNTKNNCCCGSMNYGKYNDNSGWVNSDNNFNNWY